MLQSNSGCERSFVIKITESEQRQRKSRIIHTAFRLFRERGVDGVSMREIARASEVSEKSLYRYFDTKADLLLEAVTVLWTEIVAELLRFIDEDYRHKTGWEQVGVLLDGFRWLYQEHLDYVLFSYDYKHFLIRHDLKLSVDAFSDELAPMHEAFVQALSKGMADGTVRPCGTPEDVYWSVWGLMRGYVAKIAIYDQMYAGLNPWRGRFELARNLILQGLRGPEAK